MIKLLLPAIFISTSYTTLSVSQRSHSHLVSFAGHLATGLSKAYPYSVLVLITLISMAIG